MATEAPDNERLRRLLLLHLLEHHGQQVRFEASQWATEFGMLRRFPDEDPVQLRSTLRGLEMARLVFQRTQYVVGYSEPKIVYSLTPSGHRQALEFQQPAGDATDPNAAARAPDESEEFEARSAPTG